MGVVNSKWPMQAPKLLMILRLQGIRGWSGQQCLFCEGSIQGMDTFARMQETFNVEVDILSLNFQTQAY